MIRLTRIAAAVVVAAAMSASAAAQDTLAKRVSLDLKAMPPAEAFKVIAQAISHTVAVAPEVTTPVDIVVRNVTAKTALNTICESIGCTWRVTGTAITVSDLASVAISAARPQRLDARADATRARTDARPDRAEATRVASERLRARFDQKLPADMVFENTPLPQVTERLSKATGLEITISGDMPPGQTFSADLSNRPFSAALTALSQQLDGNVVCRMRLPKGEGGIIAFHIGPKARR
jgi:type II secretory pathway component GspD/PulD (secretin)